MTEHTPREGEPQAAPGPVTRDRNPLEYWARAAATPAPAPARTTGAPAPAPSSPAAAEAQEELLDAITRATRAVATDEPGAAADLERLARAYAWVVYGGAAGR